MSNFSDSAHQFDPLIPSDLKLEPLLTLAHELTVQSMGLGGVPVPKEFRSMLRQMNSWYSSRIEGQHTSPSEVAAALRQDFSQDERLAVKQRLAVAHVQAEEKLEALYEAPQAIGALFSKDALLVIHRVLYEGLPASDLAMGQGVAIVPGALRSTEVSIGRHIAPLASVEAFITRWADFYGLARRGEAKIVAMAASHQRLGWIHPFQNGNGQVIRLHTHLILKTLGLTSGLWSPTRGFARSSDRYHALLAAADAPGLGQLDGRRNLSENGLVDWIQYVLEVCLQEVRFMKSLLNPSIIEDRIAACLIKEEFFKTGVRLDALRPLHYLFLTDGEMERGEFKRMLGLGERTAVTLLSALIKRGLLKSDSPQGRVRYGLPMHALRFYFPALWPEGEADSQV